jgi:membrane protein DedA with SNARE-associated domain
MVEFFNNLFNHIDPLTAYLVLLISAYVENIIPPVPGDTVVVLGAYLVSIEKLNFWGVYISTSLGSVTGFATMYYIGRHFGRPFLYKKTRAKLFKQKHIAKAERWFSKWGYWVILANRFLSGTRSVISIFAGLFHLNLIIVLSLALLSTLLWNAILIIAGVLVGNNWSVITTIITRYNQVFMGLVLVIIVYFILHRYIFKGKKKRKA